MQRVPRRFRVALVSRNIRAVPMPVPCLRGAVAVPRRTHAVPVPMPCPYRTFGVPVPFLLGALEIVGGCKSRLKTSPPMDL